MKLQENRELYYVMKRAMKQASPEGSDNDEDGEFHTTIKKQSIDV